MIKLDLLNCCSGGFCILTFELKIETSSSIESMLIFFNLETKNNYIIKIPVILSSDGESIEVRIPESLLSSVLDTSEEYSFTLEVLIDDRLFIPLQDTLSFISPPKMTASCKLNSSSLLPQISVLSNQETISSPKIDFTQKEIEYPVSDGSSHTFLQWNQKMKKRTLR